MGPCLQCDTRAGTIARHEGNDRGEVSSSRVARCRDASCVGPERIGIGHGPLQRTVRVLRCRGEAVLRRLASAHIYERAALVRT